MKSDSLKKILAMEKRWLAESTEESIEQPKTKGDDAPDEELFVLCQSYSSCYSSSSDEEMTLPPKKRNTTHRQPYKTLHPSIRLERLESTKPSGSTCASAAVNVATLS